MRHARIFLMLTWIQACSSEPQMMKIGVFAETDKGLVDVPRQADSSVLSSAALLPTEYDVPAPIVGEFRAAYFNVPNLQADLLSLWVLSARTANDRPVRVEVDIQPTSQPDVFKLVPRRAVADVLAEHNARCLPPDNVPGGWPLLRPVRLGLAVSASAESVGPLWEVNLCEASVRAKAPPPSADEVIGGRAPRAAPSPAPASPPR